MQSGAALPNGTPFPVLTVSVAERVTSKQMFPSQLSHITRLRPTDSINDDAPRMFRMAMGHMNWLINDRTFGLEEVADDEIVRLNSQESWLLSNDGTQGGGMGMMGSMNMPHPIHIHGVQF